MIWDELATPEVRDLAWACFSPPLLLSEQLGRPAGAVSNCGLTLESARQERLLRLDRDPQALLEYLATSHSTRLGIYFEKLWHFFLQDDEETELVCHNLPVRDGGRTLGEYDCIYYCRRRQRHVHLELAVKFYLETRGDPRWLGPGCRDSLEDKTRHMAQHQIRLSGTAAGREALESLGIDTVLAEIEMKGYLFSGEREPLLPHAYNPARQMSTWCTWSDFPQLAATQPDVKQWRILPRKRWLAPCDINLPGYSALSHVYLEQLQEHFSGAGQPLLLAGVDESGRERSRCFLAPAGWPHQNGRNR